MHNTILDELIENGFVIIEDFLTPEETDELYKAGRALSMEAPQENRKVFSGPNSQDQQSKDQYFLESGDKVRYFFEGTAIGKDGQLLVDPLNSLNKVGHALHVENPTFKNITFSNRVKEVCWQLNYRKPAVCQSMYIFKQPKLGEEVIPHQDDWYLHTEPSTTVGFWIALEDATMQNGCLQFIKGSHKSGLHRRYIRNPDAKSTDLLIYDRPAPIYPSSNYTPAPVSKGTLIVIHGQVVHRSDQNRSDKSRNAYTFHVIETENTKYCEDNWLQPPEDKPFPLLYSRTD